MHDGLYRSCMTKNQGHRFALPDAMHDTSWPLWDPQVTQSGRKIEGEKYQNHSSDPCFLPPFFASQNSTQKPPIMLALVPCSLRQGEESLTSAVAMSKSTLFIVALIIFFSPRPMLSQVPFEASESRYLAVREIIAHRGSSGDRPENTMSSFRRAIDVGATAIEIDLRTSSDGHLVILHDSSVARTTDGEGEISALSLGQIQKLDAGSKFDKQYAGERIPTFADVCQTAKSSKVRLLLDLKENGGEYARKIAALIRQYGIQDKVIVGVRSEGQAREFRKELPDCVQLGFIPTPGQIESFRAAGVDRIRLWSKWLPDDSLVLRVRKSGAELQINVGKGSLDEVEPMLRYRPEAILCDDPALLLKSLATLRSKSTIHP